MKNPYHTSMPLLIFSLYLILGMPIDQHGMDGDSLLLHCSFEEASDLDKWTKETCRPGSLKITRQVARKGKAAARFEFTKADVLDYNGHVRSELRLPGEQENERWYGFSNYLPEDFVADPLAEKIAQWHEIPDRHLGENWRSPPISLGVENDRFYVQILWAAAAVNTNKTLEGNKKIDLGPAEKSKWNDWVFHIRFSYKEDGILEIWKNKEKVFSYAGPNSYNDKNLPYFKIGIYKWGWKGWAEYSPEDKRVLYYDEIKIAGSKANWRTVSPK